MAVTSKEITETRTARQIPLPRSVGPIAYLITGVLAMLAIYVLVGAAVSWAQVRIDDIRYGRPRTTQIAGLVGHGPESASQPTRLIGMNIDRQVVVLELPAGDSSQVRSLPGPYLFGANEDLTPVLLSLRDMDRDGLDDLIIDVRNEQIVYLNRDGSFRLPTPDEQQQLLEEHGS
ncbi:hypothetical protein K2Z83_08900 [Oscillochloris sp. ZM17-4]|uniref:hypothetical protein n=1 Tax=Oscillochloris sp. ZM17-4 TaxID=2866714 RepID=UPI001C72BFEA|nr:hypothetical protein [Oscillochloris sp. ZM17-4]MBX0327793.1 hypothetical protein [Oscillochloris sp. ZM17-4]